MSVPNSYFGTKYQQALTAAGIPDEKIFGRVTKVVDSNQQFEVKWDLDGETMTMSLNKVQYESVDTPLQIQSETSILTAEEFEGMPVIWSRVLLQMLQRCTICLSKI